MKVVRSALQNAASVAGLMLTTEALIAEQPEGREGRRPAAVTPATATPVNSFEDARPSVRVSHNDDSCVRADLARGRLLLCAFSSKAKQKLDQRIEKAALSRQVHVEDTQVGSVLIHTSSLLIHTLRVPKGYQLKPGATSTDVRNGP